MNIAKYMRKVNKLRSIPSVQERKRKMDELYLKEAQKDIAILENHTFKQVCSEVMSNVLGVILFFALLPAMPIVYIIDAIKGQ